MPRFAQFDDICSRCGNFIAKGARIAHCRAGWIHAGCANGQDDE